MTPRPPGLLISGQGGPIPAAATAAPPFAPSLAGAVERCWRRASAPAEWNLPIEEFKAALERSVARRFPRPAATKAIEQYLEVIHAPDLALALACSAGNAAAWDFFVAKFSPELYRAAQAIVGRGGSGSDARDLADALYADLYGLRESEGRRKSLFEYFHGRSKLTTWLHAVLAQRHVDEIRRARKTQPLENEAGEERGDIAVAEPANHGALASSANSAHDPEREKYLAMLQAALTAVILALDPRDRLRLAYYYADDRTLAEIGKLLGEHEATVSRKLDRTRRDVRERVEAQLRDEKKMSAAQVRSCCEYAGEEWPFDLTGALRASGPAGANMGGQDQAPAD